MGFITISHHHVLLFSKHRRFANPRFVHIQHQKKNEEKKTTYCWWFRNPAPVEVGRLSHYLLPGFKNIQTVVISRIYRIFSPTFWHQKTLRLTHDSRIYIWFWKPVMREPWCRIPLGDTDALDTLAAPRIAITSQIRDPFFFWREGNNGALLGGSSQLV